ncbi:hypothetical protein ACFL21_02010 [Patescibacteria group bacterium]
MNNPSQIPDIIKKIDLQDILRIDYALEGDWDKTLEVIWKKNKGLINFDKIIKSHKTFQPTIELFFEDHFLGIMCYKETKDGYIFDEEKAKVIIQYIEKNII